LSTQPGKISKDLLQELLTEMKCKEGHADKFINQLLFPYCISNHRPEIITGNCWMISTLVRS